MDKVTQQNAANAEESASSSEELTAQAETMNEMVNELAALVGGNNWGKQDSQPRKSRDRQVVHAQSNRVKSPHSALTGGRPRGQSDKVFHRIADGNEHAVSSAERAIPLDDDLEHFNS